MQRRAAGLLLLFVALVAALVVPQILRPGTTGQPSAAPLPEPPPVGTCVDIIARSLIPRDCTDAHDAEVFARWLADDPDRPRGRDNPVCDQLLTNLISPQLPSYDGWYLTVVTSQNALFRAPDDERVLRRGWSVCVARPGNLTPYTGLLIPDVRTRPGQFGNCLAADGVTEASCTEPHHVERLAVASGYGDFSGQAATAVELPTELTDRLQEQCRQIAEDLTGNRDPTFRGALTVELTQAGVTRMGEQAGSYRPYGATCVLRSAAPLAGSVVGLGDAPLPLA